MTRRILLAAALAALLAEPLSAAQPSFAKYVAVGDSLTAGFTNGSLVLTHQPTSWPALLAGQTGTPITSFQQPYITDPGAPAELALVTLSPLVIAPKSSGTGLPANYALDRPYDNLAVPGATSVDVVTRTTGGLHDAILRGKGTQLQQAVSLSPTFVTLWIGSNDVLGAVTNGRAIDGVTMVPLASFRAAYALTSEHAARDRGHGGDGDHPGRHPRPVRERHPARRGGSGHAPAGADRRADRSPDRSLRAAGSGIEGHPRRLGSARKGRRHPGRPRRQRPAAARRGGPRPRRARDHPRPAECDQRVDPRDRGRGWSPGPRPERLHHRPSARTGASTRASP